jgi:hypothetical protein
MPSSPAVDVRAASAAVSREFQLNAFELPYILTLPILRQQFVNWAENWAVYLAGLGKSAVGIGQSVLAIPEVTVQIVQQVLALDFVGAFDTFTSAVRNAVIAIGQPLLDSLIWRNQKLLAAQTALEAAVPKAFIDVVNGFLVAGNGVVTSLIVGTQDFIGAVLTLNLGNIVNAALDGTRNFLVALGAGAGAIVAGIEAAQLGISTALATPPPPSPFADVSALRTLAVDRTFSLAEGSRADTVDAAALKQAQPATSDVTVLVDSAPSLVETTSAAAVSPPTGEKAGATDVVATSVDAEPQDPPKAPAAADATDPAAVLKKRVDATPVKVAPKEADEPVKKVTAGVEKDDEAKADAGAKKDAGTDAKPASDSDGE